MALDRSEFRNAVDADLATLDAAKDGWARTPVPERIEMLEAVKARTAAVAEEWALTASRAKGLPEGSAREAEEWLCGPYAVIRACDALIVALSGLDGRSYLRPLKKRYLPSGQLAVSVMPHSIWDQLFFSGMSAEVWMKPGVSEVSLPAKTAGAYMAPEETRTGKVALVLGAGNIASIPPLDCFQKLFQENQVVLLKMNPVMASLTAIFRDALAPLIERNALRIVDGDGAAGAYLTTHDLIEELHITGAGATHDRIVWGQDPEAAKAAGTPVNPRRMTSELGAVCPTIVVPGPWSHEDLRYQGEQIATQKLVNSGFNCIACQVLVIPEDWSKTDALLKAIRRAAAKDTRPAYYPGAAERLAAFAGAGASEEVTRQGTVPLVIGEGAEGARSLEEAFSPALALHRVEGEGEAYLRAAIAYANDQLHGTLGANIVIHPKTIAAMGKRRFEAALADLRYGNIAVNAWTGVSFVLPQVPWGAFPGHTLDDVQSGMGVVHNGFMFDASERTFLRGPFAPFPRSLNESLGGGDATLMPKPIWFLSHRNAGRAAKALTRFTARPNTRDLLRLFWYGLRS